MFASEAEARAMVERCLATGGDGWKNITSAYTTQQQMRDQRSGRRVAAVDSGDALHGRDNQHEHRS